MSEGLQTKGSCDTPLISIVSPMFNERSHAARSLESMLAQKCAGIEHIIVDGGSTDGTLELIEKYAAEAPYPVRILRNVKGGVYAALNAGIEASTGRYVATLHGSDRLASDDILAAAAASLEESGADMLYGDLHYVNDKGRKVRYYSGRRFSPRRLLDGFMPPHPTVIARRTLFQTVGAYSLRYAIAGDFDWLCRALLIARASAVYLPRDMVEMSNDGISCRWSSRLWGNNRDKYMSLRNNGFKICPLRLLKRYLYF